VARATEVEVAPVLTEAPKRRLGDPGVVRYSRERLTVADADEGLAEM
jgi:hypothetical protein